MLAKQALIASLFLLLMLPPSHAAPCPAATREIYLAAVTGESSGGIFQLQVEVRPGNGSIYTSVSPRTGFSTQESEADAVRYAFSSSGIGQPGCDVLFSMNGNFGGNSVDGPSAGAAMALATRAALLNRTIRPDIAMTGTISSDGNVGAVGGIIEKALAAAGSGARYFVSPRLKVYEALLLASASRGRDFAVIEVGSVADAEKVLFSGPSEKFSQKFSPESTPIPKGLQPMPLDADTGRFSLVAGKVVDGMEAKAKGIPAGAGGDGAALQQYFGDEIAKYRKALAMGYPFTAANAAFLLSIDAEYARIGSRQVDLNGSFSDVERCISSLGAPEKTADNFHWAVGSDLRREWAKKKLNETAEGRSGSEGYTTLRDLLFANSWCGISGSLAGQANEIGGKKADESALEGLAGKKLAEAEAALSSAPKPDYDALWHYESGLIANQSGEFGAAIYEAAYASAMQESGAEQGNLTLAVQKLATGNRSSLWGKIYYSQGIYLYQEAMQGGFSPSDAYRILAYSSELDKAASEIDSELAHSAGQGGAQAIAPEPKAAAKAAPSLADIAPAFLLGIFAGFAGAAAIWGMSRKGKGKKGSRRKARVK